MQIHDSASNSGGEGRSDHSNQTPDISSEQTVVGGSEASSKSTKRLPPVLPSPSPVPSGAASPSPPPPLSTGGAAASSHGELLVRMDKMEASLENINSSMAAMLHELRGGASHDQGARTAEDTILNFYGTYWIKPE